MLEVIAKVSINLLSRFPPSCGSTLVEMGEFEAEIRSHLRTSQGLCPRPSEAQASESTLPGPAGRAGEEALLNMPPRAKEEASLARPDPTLGWGN